MSNFTIHLNLLGGERSIFQVGLPHPTEMRLKVNTLIVYLSTDVAFTGHRHESELS